MQYNILLYAFPYSLHIIIINSAVYYTLLVKIYLYFITYFVKIYPYFLFRIIINYY